MPGPWFVSPHRDLTLVSVLPHWGQTTRHPSQYPHVPYRGYTVASQVRDPQLARQLTCFPDLVRLVDELVWFDYLAGSTDPEEVSPVMTRLTQAAHRLRERLGATAELPTHVRVESKRTSPELVTFSPEHLEALARVGLQDEADMYTRWRDSLDPFREVQR